MLNRKIIVPGELAVNHGAADESARPAPSPSATPPATTPNPETTPPETTAPSPDVAPHAAAAPNPATTSPNAAPDPFDPASLRLAQDFAASVGVKKALLTVPHRRPENSWFVRVHLDPAFRLQTCVIKLKEDREETYLVAQSLWPELAAEPKFKPQLLVTAINRQNVVFLWEANLPRPDGRADEWSRSALEAIDMATKEWVRVKANMGLGAYEVDVALGDLGDPTWPDLPFKELLRISFRDHYITDRSHPVLRRLRGEV